MSRKPSAPFLQSLSNGWPGSSGPLLGRLAGRGSRGRGRERVRVGRTRGGADRVPLTHTPAALTQFAHATDLMKGLVPSSRPAILVPETQTTALEHRRKKRPFAFTKSHPQEMSDIWMFCKLHRPTHPNPIPKGKQAHFCGSAVMGISVSRAALSGPLSVTTRGWPGQRSRPRRGRTRPKARPAVAVARRGGAGVRWGFRGGPESCVWRLAS